MICAACPERVEAPQTAEGQRALTILSRAGVWRRLAQPTGGGSITTITGLDTAELRARAPEEVFDDALAWGLHAEASVIAASEEAAIRALEEAKARAR